MLGESLWVAAGQLVAALGTLVGVRIQTEVIPPDVFGEAVLLAGLSTLTLTIVGVPYARGAMLFYGEVASNGLQEWLFHYVRKSVAKHLGLAIVLLVACGLPYTKITGGSYWAVYILSALLAVDAARTVEMAFLNAKREQQEYAIWSILEAWSRPVVAVVAVLFFDAKVEVILAGYVVASAAIFVLFVKWAAQSKREYSESDLERIHDIKGRVERYSLPLMPQGLVGWLGALSDRYLLAALVGLHESGIYSAVYGLISRPFLLAQNVSELSIRPIYFHAVTANDQERENVIFRRWIVVNFLVGLALFAICFAGSNLITGYLLGAAYSGGVILIPYLAIGHLFLIVGYGLNGFLYAHEYTKQLFWFDLLAVVLSLGLSPLAMLSFGIIGAASTCAVVFMSRTIAVAIFVHNKSEKRLYG